jgi:hypothetical protein
VPFSLSYETFQVNDMLGVNDRLGIGHQVILLNLTPEVFRSSPHIADGTWG